MIWQTFAGQGIPQQLAKAPLHPIADNRITDSLSDSDPVTFAPFTIRPRQQHKTGPRNTQTGIGRKKIAALGNDAGFGGGRIGHVFCLVPQTPGGHIRGLGFLA